MPTITTKAGPWNMTVFAFDESEAENPFVHMTADDILRLPFGAAELDRSGRVVSYNDTEPGDGTIPKPPLTGRILFADVLRWQNTVVAREFAKGVETGDLNTVFDCAVARLPYKVRIHLKISPILGTYWVFVKKLQRS